jgi:hypothetical protein
MLTWQRTSNWVRLSRSIFVAFPGMSLLPTVPAIQNLFPASQCSDNATLHESPNTMANIPFIQEQPSALCKKDPFCWSIVLSGKQNIRTCTPTS